MIGVISTCQLKIFANIDFVLYCFGFQTAMRKIPLFSEIWNYYMHRNCPIVKLTITGRFRIRGCPGNIAVRPRHTSEDSLKDLESEASRERFIIGALGAVIHAGPNREESRRLPGRLFLWIWYRLYQNLGQFTGRGLRDVPGSAILLNSTRRGSGQAHWWNVSGVLPGLVLTGPQYYQGGLNVETSRKLGPMAVPKFAAGFI